MIKLSVPSIGDEECSAVERVLRSGQLVHGEECEMFERELAEYLACQDVIVVSSGTAALHLALVALGIGLGDAVIVPDFTFPATINVVELVGARPILVDVDENNYNILVGEIRRVLEEWQGPERIKAIMPVHEFGCPAEMTAIMQIAKEFGLLVIEDAACGLGAEHNKQKVGTFGDLGCFSFHPRKAITTGEGGAIATNDSKLADVLRIVRNHGIQRSKSNMDFILPGFNYRLTNFQAALGRVQLAKFNNWLLERNKIQKIYREAFKDLPIVLPAEVTGHAWQTFMIILPERYNRTEIISMFRGNGIETNLGAQGLHCQSYYKERYPEMCTREINNNAERLFLYGLALPIYQGMKNEYIDKVIYNIRDFFCK